MRGDHMKVNLQTWKETNAHWDRMFADFIARHSELMVALSATVLVVWAMVTFHWVYVCAIILIGGVSFFVGFIESVVLAGAFLVFVVSWTFPGRLDGSMRMMELFGLGGVAWLGFRHREAQRREKERLRRQVTLESVMPWAITNEIRTSLAAIRYLLFPYHQTGITGDSVASITEATDELQRLENLFYEYEQARASHYDEE